MLAPGDSTILAEPDASPPPAIAQVLADGGIGLVFGVVPIAQEVVFPDVLRLTSVAGSTAKVTLTLSGGAAGAVDQVGFWDEKRGVVENGLTIKAGEEARVAFAFELPPGSALGLLEGVLTVAATLEDGSTQQQELPFALSVEAADVMPDASASPQPASSPSAAAGDRPPLLQSPRGSLWRPLFSCLTD